MKDTRKVGVGISGSYGGLNLGDEAILQVILANLRQSVLVEFTVFSRDAEDTLRRHIEGRLKVVLYWPNPRATIG